LTVEVVAADRKVWSGEATMVVARTPEGEIGIMPGHESVLGLLVPGAVTIRVVDGSSVTAAVSSGFLSVSADHVAILAEQVALAEEIDVAAARALHDSADGGSPASAWAEVMLQVAGDLVR
jgi:F-type H+-transporting ATPase subunit epsilon